MSPCGDYREKILRHALGLVRKCRLVYGTAQTARYRDAQDMLGIALVRAV